MLTTVLALAIIDRVGRKKLVYWGVSGMVLSLLVTRALVFSAGQAYRVGSASSEVQNVADAAALAAQNEVGEFMIVVRVCDAAVLSLSLTSLVATGLGVAALCTPASASASENRSIVATSSGSTPPTPTLMRRMGASLRVVSSNRSRKRGMSFE